MSKANSTERPDVSLEKISVDNTSQPPEKVTAQEQEIRKSTRISKPSWKAQDNMEQQKIEEFWQTYSACKTVCDRAERSFIGYCPEEMLQEIISHLKRGEKDICQAYQELSDMLQSTVPPEITLVSDRTKEDLRRLMDTALSKARLWTSLGMEQHRDSDKLSLHSRRSSGSRESTGSKRVLLAAKTAALKVERIVKLQEARDASKLKHLEAEELLRRVKADDQLDGFRHEAEDRRLQGQIRTHEVELEAIDSPTNSTRRSEASYLPGDIQDVRAMVEDWQPRIDVPTPAPMRASSLTDVKPVNANLNLTASQSHFEITLAKTLADTVSLSRLPPPEPMVFSGSPLKYPEWKAAFAVLIESKSIPPGERIHYLRKYLSGEAKDAVEGTFYFDTEDAYQEAKDILEERYGNTFLVAEAFRDKLSAWPRVGTKDNLGLRKFADFLRQCQMAMSQIDGLQILNDCRENRKILLKLPEWLVRKWSRIAAQNNTVYPSFTTFVKFITREADIANNPITALQMYKDDDKPTKRVTSQRSAGASTHATNTSTRATKTGEKEIKTQRRLPVNNNEEKITGSKCVFCNRTNHDISDCKDFRTKTPSDRREFIMKTGLCFGCLSHGHRSKECPQKSSCTKCKHMHPTILHGDYTALNGSETKTQALSTHTHLDARSSMVVPVYLSTKQEPSEEHLVYALLDTQSDTTFILDDTAQRLNVKSEPARLKLSTMTSTTVVRCNRLKDLQVRGVNSDVTIPLPTTYSRAVIPTNRAHIPTPEVAERWPHLQCIASNILPLQDCEVGLLIGYNCPQALAPKNFITGKGDQPYAQETELGWSVVGRVSSYEEEDEDDIGVSHRVVVKRIPENLRLHTGKPEVCEEVHYMTHTRIKEQLTPAEVCKMLEADFPERKYEDATMSQDDLKFMKDMRDGIHQNDDGYYEMPLPFRQDKPEVPNNRTMAAKRLSHLKRRFQGNPKYHEEYRTFMDNILSHGDAEEVPDDKAEPKNAWYIPHHGVYHPKKDKIRVVFDCSARHKGTALNDHLLQGPDLMNSLIGVLCRFRVHPIAVMGDIERMFHQFRVNSEDRDYLRFLWWKDSNLDNDPVAYRMKVHLFGAKSSPGCANFGLKKIAIDNREEFGEEASNFITNDFYVDDGLRSFQTAEEAVQLIEKARSICQKGNLRLHKLVSNSREVMESIPKSEHAKEIKNLDLNFDDLPIERALGIEWCVESDHFQFRLMLKDKPMTRRGILSTVASVYDPLGCLAPFILIGKRILQEMCRVNAGWDEPLSDDLRPKWEQWLADLPALAHLQIPRRLAPDGFENITQREVHHFSDASFEGYGQCSYLRMVNDKNQVHCSLIMGKARVTPKKVVTIPRLELTAALVSVKVSHMLRSELKTQDVKEYFWTDSKVVLGYIGNEARRFHVFVANRVQQIKDATQVHQWRHVSTDQNPADHASRGLRPHEFAESSWFTGPPFLWDNTLPMEDHLENLISSEDPEVRKVQVYATTATETPLILKKMELFSDWSRAINVIVRLRRLVTQSNKPKGQYLTSHILEQERQDVQMMVIKMLQSEEFADEVKVLEPATRNVKRRAGAKGKLWKLDPFLDDSGVLRVGGRLRQSSLLYGVKHPIILPKTSHVTHLIIKHHHEEASHQGRGITIGELRSSGYWILGCTSAVSSYIYKCVICRKSRGRNQEQKMADLPKERLEPSPPFTHCGIDCFGPFMVKDGRKEMKKYGLLFTCMASRAVHVETLDDMSTDAFINGLRCFIALRGPVRSIRCDQGSNFIGAAHELKLALTEMKEDKIREMLTKNHCDFTMNPPSASHMGGVWERQIRSIRSVLTATLETHSARLDSASLRTFLYEAMAIVNSRPLCTVSLNDPSGPEPLTPNHLITMKSKVVLPPAGDFVQEDVYARKRWRRVQFLANEFWSRWKKEYLQELQLRQKWTKPQQNLGVGDVVILKDEDMIRGHWRLARVIETFPSSDGLIRKVKLIIGDSTLNDKGQRTAKSTILERPIHKLTLLLKNNDNIVK